ncbi:hypothetical protein [Deferrisoma sp.]
MFGRVRYLSSENTARKVRLRADGVVEVVNECRRGPEGNWRRARAPDPSEPAKLKESFFWPFRAA